MLRDVSLLGFVITKLLHGVDVLWTAQSLDYLVIILSSPGTQ